MDIRPVYSSDLSGLKDILAAVIEWIERYPIVFGQLIRISVWKM
jgi:hypothetical protein